MLAAVVLAAGAAERFGSPKQRLLLPGVLERVRAAGLHEIVVVAGAYELEVDERTVRCRDWQRGPGASLRCGLAALAPQTKAAIVVLADGPQLDPRAIERVATAWRDTGAPLVAAAYHGARGHPLLVARELWDDVPDGGLRGREPVLVQCSDLTPPGDVDYPADVTG